VHHGPETRGSDAGRAEHLEEVYSRDGDVETSEDDVLGGGAGGGATFVFKVSVVEGEGRGDEVKKRGQVLNEKVRKLEKRLQDE